MVLELPETENFTRIWKNGPLHSILHLESFLAKMLKRHPVGLAEALPFTVFIKHLGPGNDDLSPFFIHVDTCWATFVFRDAAWVAELSVRGAMRPIPG